MKGQPMVVQTGLPGGSCTTSSDIAMAGIEEKSREMPQSMGTAAEAEPSHNGRTIIRCIILRSKVSHRDCLFVIGEQTEYLISKRQNGG